MKRTVLAAIIVIFIISFVSIVGAQEQEAGQPLYFNRDDVKEHKSDLAPHTDPYWQQEKARYRREGRPLEEVYDNPNETIYESTTSIKRLDGGGSSESDKKPPTRWGN
ncbi:MAG: hypothetical protein HN337_09790 [Deltaproteobacteria bacterium]|jgi:hypothetical protein|nr:hypothetical protein [Deltaproteobacteria bacterium]